MSAGADLFGEAVTAAKNIMALRELGIHTPNDKELAQRFYLLGQQSVLRNLPKEDEIAALAKEYDEDIIHGVKMLKNKILTGKYEP